MMPTVNPNVKKSYLFSLLLIPVASAILVFVTHHFVFKAGVAASGILILLWLFYSGNRNFENVWLIVTAFFFSIIGDWFLSNKHDLPWMFIAGIAFFFFAHVCYLMFALKYGKININFAGYLLVAYLIFFFVWLRPGIAGMGLKAAAFFYLVISCISFSAAAGIKRLPPLARKGFIFGIFLILFSDTIIALREFTLLQSLKFLILPTYYLAQISITFALMESMTAPKEEVQGNDPAS